MSYTQLTQVERYQIYALRKAGHIQAEIAEIVGDLYRFLRCQKARRKRYGTYDRRGIIPNQTSVDDRPAIVDACKSFGDWEGDTVIGKGHRGARHC